MGATSHYSLLFSLFLPPFSFMYTYYYDTYPYGLRSYINPHQALTPPISTIWLASDLHAIEMSSSSSYSYSYYSSSSSMAPPKTPGAPRMGTIPLPPADEDKYYHSRSSSLFVSSSPSYSNIFLERLPTPPPSPSFGFSSSSRKPSDARVAGSSALGLTLNVSSSTYYTSSRKS